MEGSRLRKQHWKPFLTGPQGLDPLCSNSLFFFVSELMDLLLTGEDQLQADQPNNLAEGHPM